MNENKNVLPIKMISTVVRNDFQQLLVYSIQSRVVDISHKLFYQQYNFRRIHRFWGKKIIFQ
jgi:hypothetical protein